MVTRVTDTVVEGPIEEQFAHDPTTTTGLDFGYKAGLLVEGTVVTEIAAGTITLPDDSITEVYINTSTDAVAQISVAAVANAIALFTCTTSSGAITTIVDNRVMLGSVL